MTTGVSSIVYPVKDIAKAKTLFSTVAGVEPHTDQPYYVGYRVGDLEIALDPNGYQKGMTGPTPFWSVDDMQAETARLLAAGATMQQEPHDVGGGTVIALMQDSDGNTIGLIKGP